MSLSYKELNEIKIGDIFYECSQYCNIKFTVKTLPVEIQNGDLTQLQWIGKVEGEGDINYLITKGLEHYGPKIYKIPAYVGVPQKGF